MDELYSAGEYERALFIDERELPPRGDKYAQYMVGYMHLNAHGLPQDKVRALAWYRLAAERGNEVLVRARDELVVTLTDAEIAASILRQSSREYAFQCDFEACSCLSESVP